MDSFKKLLYAIIVISIIIVIKFKLIALHMFEMFIIIPVLFYISSKLATYDNTLITRYFEIHEEINEEKKNYIKNIFEKRIKVNSIIVLAMTPFAYYIEFFVSSSYKIGNTFILNRLLLCPLILGAIILLATTPIFVKKQYFKEIHQN